MHCQIENMHALPGEKWRKIIAEALTREVCSVVRPIFEAIQHFRKRELDSKAVIKV